MKAHRWFTPYILVAPAVIWVLVFSVWPFLNTVFLSFFKARPLLTPEFAGLTQYARLFKDEQFFYAVTTSFVYTLICVPVLTLLPLLIALLVQKKVPGIGAFRTTLYFPVIASVVVVGIIWTWMFESQGLVNQTLEAVGLTDGPVNFLTERWLIIATAALLTIWKGIGYYMVVYLAALGNVDDTLYEAAELDGAGAMRKFWSVTVPGVRGGMLLVSALIAASGMRIFSEIYVLTNGTGGPGGQSASVVMLIKQVGSGLTGQLGYASAISVILFFLTFIPLAILGVANQGDFLKNRRAAKRLKRILKTEAVPA